MDEMKGYEVKALLDFLPYSHKQEWEIARQIIYCEAQVHSKKKLKPTDIMKFQWEEPRKEKGDTTISTSEVNRLRELAKKMK